MLALLTRTSYSHTSRYVSWLEAEGFIERQGRNPDNRITFRNTGKARAHPETPYPPIRPTDFHSPGSAWRRRLLPDSCFAPTHTP